MPYSMDIRNLVVRAYDEGMAHRRIAKTFHVSTTFVQSVVSRRKYTGAFGLYERGHRRPKVTAAGMDVVHEVLTKNNEITMPELAKVLTQRCGIEVAPSTLSRTLRRHGYTRKKKRYMRLSVTPKR